MNPSATLITNTENKARFRELSSGICAICVREGIPARAWRDPSLMYFTKLPFERQIQVLNNLEARLEVLHKHVVTDKKSIHDSVALTKAFLNKLNLTTPPELDSYLAPEDYIAVYNRQHSMIYFSPNHLLLLSYSFEDLSCRSWMEMFKRDKNIEQILVQQVMSLAEGRELGLIVNDDIAPHFITEISSPELRSGTCQSKVHSPIFENGKPAGYLSVNRGIPAEGHFRQLD